MSLNLIDVECILIESNEVFQVEYNEEDKKLTLEDILDTIHNKPIKYIDFIEDSSIFIRFKNNESLFIEI